MNSKNDFAPLGAICGTAPNGADVRWESKFYKLSAPIGATEFSFFLNCLRVWPHVGDQVEIMRLDLFLKVSRLILRRSVAQELCDAGLIFVNGSKAKASKEVKAGDRIEIKRRSRHTSVEVVNIPASKQVSKDTAGGLYRVLEDIAIDDDPTN